MGYGNWLRRGRRRKGASQGDGHPKRRGTASNGLRANLSFEPLEDRRMLVTFLVITTADLDVDGNTVFGSLRWAVERANATDAFDTIVFADSLFIGGGTAIIGLTEIEGRGGTLTITQPVDILGPGP